MKKATVKEKSCENCRYFSQHYSIQETWYGTVNCGHCLNVEKKIKRKPDELCELWENIAIKKEEREKSIEEILRHMSKRINEIAIILTNDKEEYIKTIIEGVNTPLEECVKIDEL